MSDDWLKITLFLQFFKIYKLFTWHKNTILYRRNSNKFFSPFNFYFYLLNWTKWIKREKKEKSTALPEPQTNAAMRRKFYRHTDWLKICLLSTQHVSAPASAAIHNWEAVIFLDFPQHLFFRATNLFSLITVTDDEFFLWSLNDEISIRAAIWAQVTPT